MFLNIMMFLYISKCHLPRILLRETLRKFTSIQRTISLKPLNLKRILNQVVQTVKDQNVIIVTHKPTELEDKVKSELLHFSEIDK